MSAAKEDTKPASSSKEEEVNNSEAKAKDQDGQPAAEGTSNSTGNNLVLCYTLLSSS